ncbi:MAG: ABC transporter substrate-binding protein [Proteobacteria bacterium]|nr:ABC transporter substrate-binding protein [Pseudomonadota bacterium]
MKNVFTIISSALFITFLVTGVDASTRIKIATLAPEGTTWMKVMREMAKEVEEKTSGEVKIKFYSGGVMGDEGDVIRKMKFGQVHGGAFTGRGLGDINPEERVLELPFLFDNYEEADCVTKKVQDRLAAGFEKKGFVLIGWAEAGFVYVFTNKPVYTANDIKGVKMWMWEGDPLAKALSKANGIVPVPLDLPNVLTSMQTGLIDAVYSSPYAVVALQWHNRVKYMIDLKLSFATGALLLSKKQFDKLSPEAQKIMREVVAKNCRRLTELTRKENKEAIDVLKKSGIKISGMKPKQEVDKIKKSSTKIYNGLVGTLYSRELLEETLRNREECRKSQK